MGCCGGEGRADKMDPRSSGTGVKSMSACVLRPRWHARGATDHKGPYVAVREGVRLGYAAHEVLGRGSLSAQAQVWVFLFFLFCIFCFVFYFFCFQFSNSHKNRNSKFMFKCNNPKYQHECKVYIFIYLY
jgi:hypothetical protein